MKMLAITSLALVAVNALAAAHPQERFVEIAVSGPSNGSIYVSLYNAGNEDVEIGPMEYGQPSDLVIGDTVPSNSRIVLAQPGTEAVRRWGIPRILFPGQFIGRSIPISKLGIPSGECHRLSFKYVYANEDFAVASRNSVRKTICFKAGES